jgi:hypothetical protein
MEQDFGIAVCVPSLSAHFSIDRRCAKGLVFEKRQESLCKMVSEFLEGKSGEGTGNAGGTGHFFAFEAERFSEGVPMGFCPAHQDGHLDDLGKHADKDR